MRFLPEERLTLVPGPYPQPLAASGWHAAASPARAGLAVCDMRTFGLGVPGGGGCGVALKLYSSASVRAIDGDQDDIHSGRPLVVLRFVSAYRQLLGLKSCYEIKTSCGFGTHTGLGSTGSLAMAVLTAVNQCHGQPLSVDQLRELIGRNYAEEDHEAPDHLMLGYETGMAGMAAREGGFFVLSTELVRVYTKAPFAQDCTVFIVVPAEQHSSKPELEEDTLTEGALSDQQTAERKAYILLMQLVPALERDNWRAVCDAVWGLQTVGSKVEEVRRFNPDLLSFMQAARAGDLFPGLPADSPERLPCLVGMSSVGPSTLVVVPGPAEQHTQAVEALVAQHGCELKFTTGVDNQGVRSVLPHLVYVVGGPGAGKTTLCQALEQRLSGCHVKVSSLIRDFVSAHPEDLETAALQRVMETGQVHDTPQHTTSRLVVQELQRLTLQQPPAPSRLMFLDGCPRSVPQAAWLDATLRLPTVLVLVVDCGADQAAARLEARGREGPGLAGARLAADETLELEEFFGGPQPQGGRYQVHHVDGTAAAGEVLEAALALVGGAKWR